MIEKVFVGESYDWCYSMVVVSKKDLVEFRIIVDFTVLNRFVKRLVYFIRLFRDVVVLISKGMKFFTKLDSRYGYW